MSPRPWFRPYGLLFLPVSWQGWGCSALTLAFSVQSLLAVDRHAHSVSDTFYGAFPYVVPAFLLLNWIAGKKGAA